MILLNQKLKFCNYLLKIKINNVKDVYYIIYKVIIIIVTFKANIKRLGIVVVQK